MVELPYHKVFKLEIPIILMVKQPNPKQKQFPISLSEKEKAEIVKAAENQTLSISAFIRRSAIIESRKVNQGGSV